MAHVSVGSGPGIRGLLDGYPTSGAALRALADALLVADSPLSRADRELIATYVSSRNGCHFCTASHAAAARALGDPARVDAVLAGELDRAGDLRALLTLAEHVRAAVAPIPDAIVAAARAHGYDDRSIHVAALIAAAFCMFNRYVDGLATESPRNAGAFVATGEAIAKHGYVARK